ncbi:50S ribosomal protein L7ae [Candidatus Woesearchaeota archaeon]|nr:MAG: 50S ribosomal protein L7ae [Candidatus Woesearchaeota archaeon]
MAEDKEIALEAIETAKNTGKIKKGINEATKALERGTAQLVVYAKDVQPAEIVMHLPILAKEKGVPCIEVPSKEELGTAAGIPVSTTAVVVINAGDAKKMIQQLSGGAKPKESKPEKEEAKGETKKETEGEKKEETKDEKKEEAKGKEEVKGEAKKETKEEKKEEAKGEAKKETKEEKKEEAKGEAKPAEKTEETKE